MDRKSLLLWLFFCFCVSTVSSQDKFTLNGYVKDSLTGETLIAANLYFRSESKGVSCNQYGFYSITLKKGNYTALATFVGYQSKEVTIVIN